MSRINAYMKIWLFDLAHGNLNDSTVLSGFVKYYVLHDMNVHDVVRVLCLIHLMVMKVW